MLDILIICDIKQGLTLEKNVKGIKKIGFARRERGILSLTLINYFVIYFLLIPSPSTQGSLLLNMAMHSDKGTPDCFLTLLDLHIRTVER